MRGSTSGQVTAIIKESFEEGYHKHEAKEELAGMTNSEKCENMKVGSFKSMEKYKSTFFSIANFAKQECGIKDITKIDNTTICKWIDQEKHMCLEGKILPGTFENHMTGMHRFEAGINMFQERVGGDRVDWSSAREYGKEIKGDFEMNESRIKAYERPEDLVNAPNLSDNEKTLAKFFLDSGCRISEAWKMKAEDISQNMNGIERAVFHGKGGLDREVDAPNASGALQALTELKAEGYTQNDFRDALREAATVTGQSYNAVHGLRHNYAQNEYNYAVKHGATSDEAKKTTSEKMGHFRPDVIEDYMK